MTPVLIKGSVDSNNNDICTYSNKDCEHTTEYKVQSFEESKDLLNDYYDYFNNNSLIKCWVSKLNNNELYLENPIDFDRFIAVSVLLGIYLIILTIVCCKWIECKFSFCNEKNKDNLDV